MLCTYYIVTDGLHIAMVTGMLRLQYAYMHYIHVVA